ILHHFFLLPPPPPCGHSRHGGAPLFKCQQVGLVNSPAWTTADPSGDIYCPQLADSNPSHNFVSTDAVPFADFPRREPLARGGTRRHRSPPCSGWDWHGADGLWRRRALPETCGTVGVATLAPVRSRQCVAGFLQESEA